MGAVGADDEARSLLDASAARGAADDADDAVAVPEEVFDGEALAHVGAGFGGGLREQWIEDLAAGRVLGVRPVGAGGWMADEREVVEVHGVAAHGWTAGGGDAIENAPPM